MNASPDRAPEPDDPGEPDSGGHGPARRAGLLEFTLPLWHRRWYLLASMVLGGAAAFGLGTLRPVGYTAQVSFVAQTMLRPSQSATMAGALPALAGLMGGGGAGGPVELYITILRSQAVAKRIIDRFDLRQAWQSHTQTETLAKLSKRLSFGSGRRDGLIQIFVEDENPVRAAAIANEYVAELRAQLRSFALEEARQRRQFYDAQLANARTALQQAQRKLQGSGFDQAALRTEPRAAAEAYGRLQVEISATEMRLTAARRVRAEGSAEVQQMLAELAELRRQLDRIELPRDAARAATRAASADTALDGEFISRLREFRYAEATVEALARQAETARVDEASDPLPLQVLDAATPPELPSHPRLLLWLLGGLLGGLLTQVAWSLARHRAKLARRDPDYMQRVQLLRSIVASRR